MKIFLIINIYILFVIIYHFECFSIAFNNSSLGGVPLKVSTAFPYLNKIKVGTTSTLFYAAIYSN